MTISRLADMPEFKLCKPADDIRGWKVLGRGQERIGIIEDLLVDVDACTVHEIVVYLDVDRKDVRIPIGALTLDEKNQLVHVEASLDQVRMMPQITEWHSRERQLVRATFFPQLADAPLLGELELHDTYFKSKEPRVSRLEHSLWSYRKGS